MKRILIFIGLFFIACNAPKQYTEKITVTETLKKNCATSYKKIKREWRKHASENCYYISAKFNDKGFVPTFEDCFTDLDMSKITEILGPATSISEATDSIYRRFDIYKYSLSTVGKCEQHEWELQFYVTPSTNIVDRVNKILKYVNN